jgi:hypothetical protein
MTNLDNGDELKSVPLFQFEVLHSVSMADGSRRDASRSGSRRKRNREK